jgi:O-antigen ligase
MGLVTIFLLFVLPLVVFPFFSFAFEPPKVLLAQIGIEVLVLLSLFLGKGINFKKLNPKLVVLCLVLFLLSLVHLPTFPEQSNLFGNIFRLQGVVLLWHLLLFAVLSSQVNISKISRNTFLISFLGILLSALLMGENRAERAVGTLGEPNALAATAVILLPFIIFSFKNIWVRVASVVLTLVVILLARSTSGLLAFALETIFIQLSVFRSLPLYKTYLLFLIVIGLALALPFVNLEKQLEVLPASSPFQFESRSEIWETAFISGFESPLIGKGFGGVQQALHETSEKLNNNTQYQVVDSSHNFLLDYWVQGGLVGLISVALLIVLSIKGLLAVSKRLELALFLAVITAMLFNPVSVVTLLFFWWLVGQGFQGENT